MKCSHNKKVPPIVSLVGCSNSGKTTFLEKLLREFKYRGYRIGTVKHHRGAFEFDIEGKDTWRHSQAGAEVVVLATPNGLGVVRKLEREVTLEEIVSYMNDVDLIIVEGFKRGPQPKIELVRSDVSNTLVCNPEELLAVVSDLPLELGVPVFDFEDIVSVANLIENRIVNNKMDSTYSESLTPIQQKRYHRNIKLPGVGELGQMKLLNSSVLVVGAGGIGSPVAYYLGAAGIGKIGLVDGDVVDYSNLQRQILHATADLGRPKVESAKDKLEAINPDIEVITYKELLTPENAVELIQQYDLVVDATDNLTSRYVINQACVKLGKPFIHGGVLSMVGQVMTVLPGQGPCFRCIFRDLPDKVKSTSDLGILGSIAGIIGCIQATEAVKYILGQGDLLVNRMLTMDGLTMSFLEVEIRRDPKCPDCGGSNQ